MVVPPTAGCRCRLRPHLCVISQLVTVHKNVRNNTSLRRRRWSFGDPTRTPRLSYPEESSHGMLLLTALLALVAVHLLCAAQQQCRCSVRDYRAVMRQTSSRRAMEIRQGRDCQRCVVRTISPARWVVEVQCGWREACNMRS